MDWLFSLFRPDWEPVGDFKMSCLSVGRQFTWKDQHWGEIMKCASQITEDEIHDLTKSMDKRLFSVIQKNGAYIKHWLFYILNIML